MVSTTSEEYKLLKASFAALFELVAPKIDLPPEKHPIAVLEAMEKSAPGNAIKGLTMALNDFVEDTLSWPHKKVAEVDQQFAAAGLFTLSQLRERYSRAFRKVIKRGKINNMEEYYLLKGILNGSPTRGEESEKLEAILTSFENQNPSENL